MEKEFYKTIGLDRETATVLRNKIKEEFAQNPTTTPCLPHLVGLALENTNLLNTEVRAIVPIIVRYIRTVDGTDSKLLDEINPLDLSMSSSVVGLVKEELDTIKAVGLLYKAGHIDNFKKHTMI